MRVSCYLRGKRFYKSFCKRTRGGTAACFTGLKFNLKLSYCPLLSRASILAAIKGVYDFSQDANFDRETAYATLTLGETLSEKLEENDIDILIAKGWDFV